MHQGADGDPLFKASQNQIDRVYYYIDSQQMKYGFILGVFDHRHGSGHLDDLSLRLALLEPLPGVPQPLPRAAPHLLETLAASVPNNGQSASRPAFSGATPRRLLRR